MSLRSLKLALVFCFCAGMCSEAWGQEFWHGIRTDCGRSPVSSMSKDPTGTPELGKWHKRIACAVDFFSDSPAHFTVGSVVPGSGFGAGVALQQEFDSDSKHRVLAGGVVYTTSGFWSAKGEFLFQPFAYKLSHNGHLCLGPFCTKDRFNITLSAMHRELPKMDFFGLGSGSGVRAFNFGERDTVGSIIASLPVTDWLRFMSSVDSQSPVIAPSADPASVRQSFTETTLAGSTSQPLFMRYGNGMELDHLSEPPYDAVVRVDYVVYQALEQGRYSFAQFKTNVQASKTLEHDLHEAPGSLEARHCPKTGKKIWTCDYGELAFRSNIIISNTGAGQVVPFYYQPTLGGQDIDGNETLRAYPNYRFRGSDSELFQAEYSHNLGIHFEYKRSKGDSTETKRNDWANFAGYVFYDAGTVGFTVSDLSLQHLRQDAGVGLKVKAADTVAFHVYVGLGASGGPHWGWNLAKAF